ncbi:MAG: DUF2147 domain-containing protein [Fimbriimonadaceae bacterium]|nr:DUF2147 domain-containing protein [Chitinophagales bacterium]
MKKICCSVFILFSISVAQAQYSDVIIAKWLSGDGDGKIEVYKQGNKYYGKLVWLKEPFEDDGRTPKVDDENPDESKQNQPLIGLVILKNFEFKEGFWQEGSIYDPANGRTYDCEMWLDGNDKLKIRGYWGFVHRTETWTRSK